MTEAVAPPRIFKVEYKAIRSRRVGRVLVKVPYGVYKDSLYLLNETLTRAQLKGHIEWFKVSLAKTPEIREAKEAGLLARWPVALARSTERTKVVWE